MERYKIEYENWGGNWACFFVYAESREAAIRILADSHIARSIGRVEQVSDPN